MTILKRTGSPLLLAALVLGAALATIAALNRPEASPTPLDPPVLNASAAAAPIPTAPLAAPARSTMRGVKAAGNVISASQATLAFQIAGRVKEVKVREGERVKAGTVIAALDAGALDAQVAQAQALLALATSTRDNPQELNARIAAAQAQVNTTKFQADVARANATSAETLKDAAGGRAIAPQQKVLMNNWYAAQSQLQAAIAAYEGAQNNLQILLDMRARPLSLDAQVAQAQAALEQAKQGAVYARIVAPFDGSVVWVGPKISESVVPGMPVVIIADLSRMQVQANVDENTLSAIQIGQSAMVTVDALPGITLTGHVVKIGFLATAAGGLVTVPVTIEVDGSDASIVPGLSATVEFQETAP